MDSYRQKKNHKACLPNGGGVGQRKSVFGKYSDPDMLSWLKGLAINPCTRRASRSVIRPLWNQSLKVRKVMALSGNEFPRRKRKLQQFLKDKFAAARRLSLETSDDPSIKNLSNGQLSRASSTSCLLNSVDFAETSNQKNFLNSCSSGSVLTTSEDNFPGKQAPTEFFHLDNVVEWATPNKYIYSLVESDESVNGSIPVSPENLTIHNPASVDLNDWVHGPNSASSKETKQVYLQSPRRSIRLLNFIGDHLQRTAIPIGPLFQADVPGWTGPPNKGNLEGCGADSENTRWLGTRIWPLEGNTTATTVRKVGKGRPDSCPCVSPGSIDCTKHHIHEERLRLQSDLGTAFLSWRFDVMGEEVSKSWTLREQESFESLAKTYPLSKGKNFLKHALKCFPSKGKESILSYYFNVFIPRHMNLQNRLS